MARPTTLFILFVVSISCFQNPKALEEGSSAFDDLEYTERINSGLREKHLEKIETAKKQGELERIFYWLFLLALLTPSIASYIRKSKPVDNRVNFFASIPNILNLSSFLVLNSLGNWGSMKHPQIHEYVEEHKELLWDVFLFSIAISLFLYVILIRYSLREKKTIKPVLLANGAIYVISVALFFGFALVAGALVS
jgi:hypothetical protein